MTHTVTDIQRFCMHDGPGLRTTVFLKGCPLRCFWCHNPETQSPEPQLLYHSAKCIACGLCASCPAGAHTFENGIHRFHASACVGCGRCTEHCPTGALSMAGRPMSSEEIIETVLRDQAFYGADGGITLSGGEPMYHPEACLELLRMAKEKGLHTAVETCGHFPSQYVEDLCRYTDCLLWDVKDSVSERHKKNTGVSNSLILENLKRADAYGTPIILRCILLRGINLNEAHLRRVRTLFDSLRHGLRIDYLPCHALGGAKEEALGRPRTDLSRYLCRQSDIETISEQVIPKIKIDNHQ